MNNLKLEITKRTDERLLDRMETHYSHPKGFVGRNICYAILYDDVYYGHIVGGSATRFLPGRNEFFGIDISSINYIVNNIFYDIKKVNGEYPVRNFTSLVVSEFVRLCAVDWEIKYGDRCIGFESLVEPPRTGELYKRCGWVQMPSMTKGFTCKRISSKLPGSSLDSYSGRRRWDTKNLRPKLVFCYKLS